MYDFETENRNRLSGRLYHGTKELRSRLTRAKELSVRANAMDPLDPGLPALLRELVPGLSPEARIETPFHCDLGSCITVGAGSRIGPGCILLDTGLITIGRRTALGPGCRLLAPHHPMDADLRRQPVQYALPVTVGDDCRLVAGVTVCPGVTIGNGSIILPGSVVIKDIPPRSLAGGSPAKVLRALESDELFQSADAVETAEEQNARSLVHALNSLHAAHPDFQALLEELVPNLPETAHLTPPLALVSGTNLTMGEKSFVNNGALILDRGQVHIGSRSLLGPSCRLLAEEENGGTVSSVHIGEDCWLGGTVTLCPGASIGDRSIVAAGSIVTGPIPPDSLAAGCPAAVKRSLASAPRLEALPEENGPDPVQRMRSGAWYRFDDPVLIKSVSRAADLCARLDRTVIRSPEYNALLAELIPNVPSSTAICPPFRCDHGHGIVLGSNIFINVNCTILDSALVRIGDNCRLGPECQLYTPEHPLNAMDRRHPVERALPVTLEEDCWLGAGIIVCPGVTIGARSVIAAGSVVTKDIPPDSLAAGCPACVKRTIRPGERSRLERD